jgi:DNA gyrase subunit B
LELFHAQDFADLAKLETLSQKLLALGHHVGDIEPDKEHGTYTVRAIALDMGHREYVLNDEVVTSGEFRQLRSLYVHLRDLGLGPIEVLPASGEGSALQTVGSREELLDTLLEAGRKGVGVQRYKGLGEMNPEQLWETTMDPAQRQLLQVRVESAFAADQLFTVLMGDAVEPRRQFIEDNALEVKNLDV